jgi:phosphoenolpyruvate synthase/pyruvate phosphate dikinase
LPIDTETGFRDAVLINGALGLGESVAQGTANPDEFYVFKPTLAGEFRPILPKTLGTKEFKLVFEEGGARQAPQHSDREGPSRALRPHRWRDPDPGVMSRTVSTWSMER